MTEFIEGDRVRLVYHYYLLGKPVDEEDPCASLKPGALATFEGYQKAGRADAFGGRYACIIWDDEEVAGRRIIDPDCLELEVPPVTDDEVSDALASILESVKGQ